MNCIYRAIPGTLVVLTISFAVGFFAADGAPISIIPSQLQGKVSVPTLR